MLQDLSGIDPQTIPPNDPDVMKIFGSTDVLGVTPEQIFSKTGTLGIPEFGTRFVRGMLEQTSPNTFAGIAADSGLSQEQMFIWAMPKHSSARTISRWRTLSALS